MTEHRMRFARDCVKQTDLPLKIMAERAGYSHVNHFNAAFRRFFDHPPGTLRRNKKK
ncbi:helix-turn-helix domain-containing protein [Methylocystis sp. ATCC 49242]|uniref:helix-turn-helix domain-containing protein n=1 Tax=Methylocystis sp. ATCC 49242 TaxID=622637 RepID=UPI003527B1E4